MKLNTRKSKISYTFMIISDSAKKYRKELHIKAGAVGAAAAVTFLLLVVLVCYLVYSSITLSDSLERSKDQMEQIVLLKEENEMLSLKKEELEGKVSILSETVNQKVEAEQALAEREEEERMPKGFPLSGTAQLKTMENAEEDNDEEDAPPQMNANDERKEVIFNASEGINAIASGAGTVISVDVDLEYGNIVSIDHGNGYISIYRNGGNPVVKAGSQISRGDILYVVGEENTDLGYSISQDSTYIDPLDIIEING